MRHNGRVAKCSERANNVFFLPQPATFEGPVRDKFWRKSESNIFTQWSADGGERAKVNRSRETSPRRNIHDGN